MMGRTFSGKEARPLFRISQGRTQGSFGGDAKLVSLLSNRLQVKGLLVEGLELRGVLLSSHDIEVGQLPRVQARVPRISIEARENRVEVGERPISLRGTGFDRRYPIEVTVDGSTPARPQNPVWEASGNFTLSLPPMLEIGGHTVLVRQRTENGIAEDATTFLITSSDEGD
jgi:hypothetical protein